MILASLRQRLVARVQALPDLKDALKAPYLEPPPRHVAADVSLNWPMALAKTARQRPMDLAQVMVECFSDLIELESASASPPGFVNLRLGQSALCANLRAISVAPGCYGRDESAPPRRILLEFMSANPTGPLHVASGRGATLGDSLARILRRLGHAVHCESYVNDVGGRIELLGRSVKARHEQSRGLQSPVPLDGYQGDYVKDAAAAAPPEAAAWTPERFGGFAMERLLNSHKRDMADFDVTFDRWYRESELHAGGAVGETLRELRDRDMVYDKDGAVWLGTSSAEGSEDDKDRVLVRQDGRPTYFLPDIAYHKDKYDRGFSELIDIFGADHHGYVPRMKAAIAALGHDPESYHAIVHQLVHLFRGSEAVKMSKRAGEFVSLREVLDEVGRDACRFFFALRTADSHLNFDLELAKKRSSENPVYYCQYVHARISSIFRGAAQQGLWKEGEAIAPVPRDIQEKEERELLVKLAWFPEVLKACARELSPHPLANYILELAGLFHPFYEARRVLDAQAPQVTRSRLALCGGVRDVIHQGLGLLGVSAPLEM